ncbi:protein transporter tim10 [Rhizophlyctis rosea]|nr:protein transporter tim10 [Rhizophlyctis rosea]
MSFGAFGGAAAAQQQLNIAMAEQELEMVTTLFNNIVDSCHKKCIPPRYQDGDLNKGESVCIDRCVAKYFAVNAKIGEKLSAAAQQGQVLA